MSDALLGRPPEIRRQVILFIRALDILARARYGRRLAAIDAATRRRFLERLENFPVQLVRRGVWGLRTLVMMGWYGQGPVQAGIGYRSSPRGWEARR